MGKMMVPLASRPRGSNLGGNEKKEGGEEGGGAGLLH